MHEICDIRAPCNNAILSFFHVPLELVFGHGEELGSVFAVVRWAFDGHDLTVETGLNFLKGCFCFPKGSLYSQSCFSF